MKNIIGIDIGGTKCAVLLADENGIFYFHEKFDTTNVDETLSNLFKLIEKVVPMCETEPVFGISCGSPLDHKKGIILSPPNLPGWDEIHITEMIEERFGGRAYLMNDANACALAEWFFGAAKGYSNVVFLTHGTGNGAGLILDERLYQGTSGDAGEIGHVRLTNDGPWGYGKNGSFEGWTSGGGIARLAQKYAEERNGRVAFNPGNIDDISTKLVAEAAKAGDELALKIFNETSYYLGKGLAILVDLFNPDIIVLGSIYSRCKELIDKEMYKALKEECLPHTLKRCIIVPAQLGEDIGNFGAVSIALYNK
jgi:glucokinase